MSIHKLFLFSKDTNAFSAQRGYNYQTLKTLETWIDNFLNNNREVIYCEFEEDIFQKDVINKELKLRQIKLYSSNFSFSSNEIKKCIAHFFTLHVKLDYVDFSKEFIFETNTNISKSYLDNDASLLKEWFEEQENLDDDKITKYAQKVKDIVSEYVGEQKIFLKDKPGLNAAIEVFDTLQESFWKNFAKMITWRFIGTPPDQEFASVRSRIEEKILQLPHAIGADRLMPVFGVLLDHVFKKVSETDYEERTLTFENLEQAILSMGNQEDRWYSKRYNYYKSIRVIEEFRIGEFYEILDLVNYCRRKKYLHLHKETWGPFLAYYSRDEHLNSLFRRKAIYELVFLINEFHEVDYENLSSRIRPKGSLFGFEDVIRYYFEGVAAFGNANDLEKARTIIDLVFVAIREKNVDIGEEVLKRWLVELYRGINQQLSSEKDINEKCNLLEQKGTFLLVINRIRDRSNIEFLKYFDALLELAENSPLYKLSQFGDRIEKYIKMQINMDPQDEMGIINALEDFSERLFPLIKTREGKVKLAQSQVRRGYSYLQTTVPKNLLKALDYFHKAKDNYLQEDTIEGFVLALLNISQLYNSVGMHFAAKNYALAAFRMSVNKELIKRVENSLEMLLHSDFSQGSWFNAINIYFTYIKLREDSNFVEEDGTREWKPARDTAFILYVMNRSSIQFKYLIDNYIHQLDYVGEDIIKPIQRKIDSELQSEENYMKAMEKHLDDFPLNDIGEERIISFFALGSLWKIRFENKYEVTSVAEEYISAIQTILVEIALSEVDFHFLKSKIEIELSLNKNYLPPEQLPSNESIKWRSYICYTAATDPKRINLHSAFNMTSFRLFLESISLLRSEEFDTLFEDFFKKSKLETKQISVNLYQKIHRDVYIENDFEAFKSYSFNKETFNLNLPKENKVMTWNDSLSTKYDSLFSLEAIKNRFNNTQKCIYLTMEELKHDPEFPQWVNGFRSQGWKDWQIVVNIQNFMINYKVNMFESKPFDSDEQYIEHFQKMFYKYSDIDEKECYVNFPLAAFKTRDFVDQFNIGLPSILQTYGLETKLTTPNFGAIKDFLDIKFNMQVDDYHDNNPLREIPYNS